MPRRRLSNAGLNRLGLAAPILILAPFVILLDVTAKVFSEPGFATAATLGLEACLVIYGYAKRPLGLLFSLFVVSVFLFLTSRLLVVGVFGYNAKGPDDWGMHLNAPHLISGTLMMQQVFLAAGWLGLVLVAKLIPPGGKHSRFKPNRAAVAAGSISLLIGAAMYMQNRISVVSAVNKSSYYDYYASRANLVSSVGRLGEALMIVGYVFILAGLPRFRVYVASSLVVLGAHGFDLLMGRRAPFVLSLLLVFFYALLRKSVDDRVDSNHRWPTPSRRWLFATVLLIPLAVLLDYISKVRAPKSDGAGGSPVLDVFYSQGITANLLTYAQTDVLKIPHDRLYSFGPLIEFVQVRLMPGFDSSLYDGQTAARALEGYNYADIVSYRIMPTVYLRGGGYGSSAVAELFWDFGWIGVAMGAFVLGMVLALSGRLFSFPIPLAAVVLIISRSILYAPRANYLDWLVGSLNVFNIVALVAITVLWKILSTRRMSALLNNVSRRGAMPQQVNG